jgi:uncharacterized protein YrrD
MQKSYREFLGLPIRDRLTKGFLGKVYDLIVNPADGEVVAIFTTRDRSMLLPTVDISRVANGVVWVENAEALATPDEIIRIADILRLNVKIIDNKVFTVSRQYLGEVLDFRFETNGWVLTKLDLAKRILSIPTERKLINSSQIVRIQTKEITVRDAVVEVKAAATNRDSLPDLSTAAFKTKS